MTSGALRMDIAAPALPRERESNAAGQNLDTRTRTRLRGYDCIFGFYPAEFSAAALPKAYR